jgi:hypothetical protein
MTMDLSQPVAGTRDVLPGAFAAALVEASAELVDVARSQEANAGQYSYRFAGLSDFLAVVRPVLHAHGLAHMQLVATEPFDKGVNVTIATMLVHASGATFTSPELRLVVPAFDAQKVGSAITYGRRYSLTTTLGIAGRDDDDDGHAVAQTTPKQVKKSSEPASYRSENEAETRRLLNAAPADVRGEVQRQFLEHFGLPLSKLPKDRHAEALTFVTERLAPPDEPDALELT